MTASLEMTTLLGPGAYFEGKLTFDGCVRIDGHFKGEVSSDGVLIVGEGALIEASLHVGTLILRGGTVHGEIQAREAVEMYAPAKVIGNVSAPTIAIERGVHVQGQCTMTGNQP